MAFEARTQKQNVFHFVMLCNIVEDCLLIFNYTKAVVPINGVSFSLVLIFMSELV